MAWPSSQPTTNLDAGTDTLALARPDIKSAVDALNSLIAYRGSTDGFTATDSSGRQVLGTNFTAGIESSNPVIRFDTGDYWIYNRSTNSVEVYKDSALICSIPFATFNNVSSLTGWASILGAGLEFSGGKINTSVSSSFCSLYKSATQSITANTDTVVTFDTAYINPTSYWASNKFTPTVAGLYRISFRATAIEESKYSRRAAWIQKNGSLKFDQDEFYSGRLDDAVLPFVYSPKVSRVIQFNGTTDYIECYFRANTAATLTNNLHQTWFEAEFIGK